MNPAPGWAESQASTVSICGTRAVAAASRSLRPSRQSPSAPRSSPSQLANTSAVESATRGLTMSTGVPETSPRSIGVNRSPAPSPRTGKLSRQAGTSLPRTGATSSRALRIDSPQRRQQSQRGGSVRRPAANPGCNGQPLVERHRGPALHVSRFMQRPSGAKHEIVLVFTEFRRESR